MRLDRYIGELVAALGRCDAGAYRRMCYVVGERCARIQVDSERVFIRMRDGVLTIESSAPVAPDGEGATDSATVCALLSGELEVSEAILNGALTVHGDIEQVNRMLHAIEILLDASPRCPMLQQLGEEFRREARCCDRGACIPRVAWYPFAASSGELDLLARYGLLPG